MGDPRKTYDVSPDQMEVIQWKDARRRQLRADYMKYYNDPKFEGEPFDPAVQRYITFKVTQEVVFKPRWNNFFWHLGVCIFPMAATYYILKTSRAKKEHMYRTGQVSYRDREFKFT